jgi:hypothetical protein
VRPFLISLGMSAIHLPPSIHLRLSWIILFLLPTGVCQAWQQKPLFRNASFAVYADSIVQQGKFLAEALSRREIRSDYQSAALPREAGTDHSRQQTADHWVLTKDISAFPQYVSPYPLADALYNLSLEEMIKAVELDSTFRTGKEWAGVWTRDISYSILLSMAYLQPRVAKYSLLKKVDKNGKIIQDTGTGGAWPASSDRMIWAVAAWELYKVTGDKDWLRQAYRIISKSLAADYEVIYDGSTGLVRGESSFLDWREQTYPVWMQPADIYASENLGTNAVHYEANLVMSQMAILLGKQKEATAYRDHAAAIKAAMNKWLWMPEKGYYAQYLYGRINRMPSPRSEALGEALSIVFGIADKDKTAKMQSRVPVTAFGIPCIYPEIPGIPPYHNNAVWPFVQTFWLWAGARAGNERSVMESICDIYRPAAMFLTNKENFVAGTGDYAGTQINSSNMLWSLSGSLSIVYKVLFGIRFNEDGLAFEPFVPQAFGGHRKMTNFSYRGARLDIDMDGYGNRIKDFYLDGKRADQALFPANGKGRHRLKIVLASDPFAAATVNHAPVVFSPAMPMTAWQPPILSWPRVDSAVNYVVLKNGKRWRSTGDTSIRIDGSAFSEYAVMSMDKNGVASFASEPVALIDASSTWIYEAEKYAGKSSLGYAGFSGDGFTETSTTVNTRIDLPIEIGRDGDYIMDCRYANGNGPINTENKCAVRTVEVDGLRKGVWVMPQRGTNVWSQWGFSNALTLHLTKGPHRLSIGYLPSDENMNIAINQAMIDYVRVIGK